MSADRDIDIASRMDTPCSEYTNLAVTDKFAVGLMCPLEEQEASAYIHGTLEVKDRADVGQLGFIIASKAPDYPVMDASKVNDSQLDLTGSLQIAGPPAGSPHGTAARFIIDGQSETTGSDTVPLQVWRNSTGSSLGVVDAAGQLGLGTAAPKASLDVVGDAHFEGGLAIGADTYSNSLTIQSTFSQQVSGTFSGQANVDTILGDASEFRLGDVFKILDGTQFVRTIQQSEFFTVKSIAEDKTSFAVIVAPVTNFTGAAIYVDQPPLAITSGNDSQLVEINRFGDMDIAGNVTVGGVLDGTGIVREAQIANGAVTLAKLSAGSVGTDQLIDGAVTNGKLAANSVGTGQIADKAVTQGKLADGAVGPWQIEDKAVTQGKLADGAVGSWQMEDKAVTTAKLADRSVTPDKMSTLMISGIVDPGGGIYSGIGFTVSRVAVGFYNVTFTPPLGSVLGGSATQIYGWPMSTTGQGGMTTDNAVIIYLGSDLLRVKTGNGKGDPEDRAFTFVVIAK